MKILTILIVILTLGLLFWKGELPSAATGEESKSVEPAPTQAKAEQRPFIPTTAVVKRKDLVTVQGRVTEVTATGIVMECEPPSFDTNSASTLVDAGSGAADIKRAAEWALFVAEHKLVQHYGELLALRNGRLSRTDERPEKIADGTILLVCFPKDRQVMPGKRMRLVAAPLGDAQGRAIYTMDYKLAPGEWFRPTKPAFQ